MAQVDLNSIYLIVGTLIVMNLGALGTGVAFLVKIVWNASQLYARIDRLEKDLNEAHSKIRRLENGKS